MHQLQELPSRVSTCKGLTPMFRAHRLVQAGMGVRGQTHKRCVPQAATAPRQETVGQATMFGDHHRNPMKKAPGVHCATKRSLFVAELVAKMEVGNAIDLAGLQKMMQAFLTVEPCGLAPRLRSCISDMMNFAMLVAEVAPPKRIHQASSLVDTVELRKATLDAAVCTNRVHLYKATLDAPVCTLCESMNVSNPGS